MLALFLDQTQHHKLTHSLSFYASLTKIRTCHRRQTVSSNHPRILSFVRMTYLSPLETLQYKVSYTQKPVVEVNLSITDIANDLRDGVRLAELLIALTIFRSNENNLLDYPRVPTVSQ